MLALYVFCAIVGGGLILLSALGGLSEGLMDGIDSHTDFDAGSVDYDHDVSLGHGEGFEHHVEMAKEFAPTSDFWLPFLSLRFWIYAVGGFGLVGTLLSLFQMASPAVIPWVAAGFGVVIGTLVSYTMRALTKGELDSSVREKDFMGVMGQLTVLPRNGEPGKVRMSIKGETIDMLAIPDGDVEFERGEEVVVVGIEGTRVRVVRYTDIMDE